MHNEQQPTNLIPINPNLRMTSLEVAELTEKQHLHIMRDVRNLIEQEAIGQSNFGLSSYVNSQNKEQPMYSLDFEATMTLITGYDAKRRNLVIKRWLALERGEAAPALASNSALDAMVGQVIQMVVPTVVDKAVSAVMEKVSPKLHSIETRVANTQINFSHYGTVWSFTYNCCQDGGYNTFTPKDELYKAYVIYCDALDCRPESKNTFLAKLYTAVVNASGATVTLNGKKTPVVRGLSLLTGYQVIIGDIRRKKEKREAAELARRRREYHGVETMEAKPC